MNKVTSFRLTSNSDRYSSLNGNVYATKEDAEEAIDELHPTGESVVYVCGEEWLYYESDEDAQADSDNSRAIARLTKIEKEDLRAFSIDDGDGTELAAGLSEYEVERVAQRLADERGEPVWYYRSPAREDEESIQVDPA